MKSNKIFFLALGVCLILGLLGEVKAQFMPTVYDHVYGKDVRFTRLCADFPNGDVVTIGENGGRVMVSWFDRQGECLLSRTFNPDEFTGILNVLPLKDGKVLLTGVRSSSDRTGDAPGGQMLVRHQFRTSRYAGNRRSYAGIRRVCHLRRYPGRRRWALGVCV